MMMCASRLRKGIIRPKVTSSSAHALRRKAIMVDDFPKDLGRTEIYQTTEPVTFEALAITQRSEGPAGRKAR